MFSTRTLSTDLVNPVVTTNSRVFAEEEEEEEDKGFAGVAVITELPRFNLESSPRLPSHRIKQQDDEEEKDIVSSEAFRLKLQQKFKSFKQRHNNVFNKGFRSQTHSLRGNKNRFVQKPRQGKDEAGQDERVQQKGSSHEGIESAEKRKGTKRDKKILQRCKNSNREALKKNWYILGIFPK